MSIGSPTAGTWSSSQWRPDNEFETDRRGPVGYWRLHPAELVVPRRPEHDYAVSEHELGMGNAPALTGHHQVPFESERLAQPLDCGRCVGVAQCRDDRCRPLFRPVGGIGWGTYQSPILIQWKSSGRSPRALNVRLVQPQPRPGIVTLRLTTVADAQYGGFTTDSSAVFWGSIDSRCVNVTVPTPGHCLTPVRAVGTIHAWILVEGDATVIICLQGNLL